MGSASIVSNLGAGQYTVNLTKSQAAIVAQKTSLTTRKGVIEEDIAAKENELTALNVIQNAKYEEWKTAVGNFAAADPPTKALRKAVTDAQKAYITAHSNVTKKQTEINLLGLELVSVNKRLEEIETALAVESKTVWCADYSDELTGSVGTLEVNGEDDQILIMPGGVAGAGLLQHPLAMTPSGVFVNSAKLPAWQKWMPTYRTGVITAISGNYCNVTLDAALSSAQSLDVNQAAALTNVPIKYMNTDGSSFMVGDHVVVQFTNQSQGSPRVVGFVTNPRPDWTQYIINHSYDIHGPWVYYEVSIPFEQIEIRSNKGLYKLVNTGTGEIFYCKEYVYLGSGRFFAMLWYKDAFDIQSGYNERESDWYRVIHDGQAVLLVSSALEAQMGTDKIWIHTAPIPDGSIYYADIMGTNYPISIGQGQFDYKLLSEANKLGPGTHTLGTRPLLYSITWSSSEKNYEFVEMTAGYNESLFHPTPFFKALADYVPAVRTGRETWKKVYLYNDIITDDGVPTVPGEFWKIRVSSTDSASGKHIATIYVPFKVLPDTDEDWFDFELYYHRYDSSSILIGWKEYEVNDVVVTAWYTSEGGENYHTDYNIVGTKDPTYGWSYHYDIPETVGSYNLVSWYCSNFENRTEGGPIYSPLPYYSAIELGNMNHLLPAVIDETPDWP